MFVVDSSFVTYRPSFRCPHSVFRWKGIDLSSIRSLQQPQRELNAQLMQQSSHWMIRQKIGLPTRCGLPQILEYFAASSRVARGKADLADDIRVLDGQCFLEALPLTHSVASVGLAIAELQPVILNTPSSVTCVSELIFICSFITSPHSDAQSRPVPPFGSSFRTLACFDLRCYLNNLTQELRHFSVGFAVVSVRVLCPISQTDFKSLRSAQYSGRFHFGTPVDS